MATILVMDDDATVRNLIKRMLEMHTYEVLDFEDAGIALETVNFDAVDLVITDLMMPTPGDQAIQTLRSRGIRVPILVLSGCCLGKDGIDRLKSLGANHCLEKPFRMTELMHTVENYLN